VKIDIVGGGPAALYFALLTKRHRPEIESYEQNPADATYGFGIVLADRGLRRMQEADEESFCRLTAAMYVTRHQLIIHREQKIFVEGTGFGGALPRLRLLSILRDRCQALGVSLHYGVRVEHFDKKADLVVGADRVNSIVRQGSEAEFGTSSFLLSESPFTTRIDRHEQKRPPQRPNGTGIAQGCG
jgi:2-polyprenyl-6-methoxyphenol hydroxylase-like FAD-dependent oxidoreductase